MGNTRAVALKLLRLDRLPPETRASASQQFSAAGRAARAATVGGMAQVVDVGLDPAGPYVASELVPGIDLAGLVHFALKRSEGTKALDPALARALVYQVARILTSAHESSPVLPHLGLSPSNIRVTPTGGVVVTDFGLAAPLRGLGKPRMERFLFVAPEIVTADPASDLGESRMAADLYSLGALLYYLLAGRPPVEADSLAALVERAWETPPALPDIPEDLERAMRALLAADPKRRLASAREAAELLAGDTASPQERREIIVNALRALEINWRSRKATKGGGNLSGGERPRRSGSRLAESGDAIGTSWGKPVAILLTVVLATAGGLALWHSKKRAVTTPTAGPSEKAGPIAYNTEEIPPGMEAWAFPHLDGGQPKDRTYVPAPKRKLPRVPGHLDLDTTPTGADVWVDGVLRGSTPVDLRLGPGGHRVVLVKEGYRLLKDVYDTTDGEWIRAQLRPVVVMPASGALLNVTCRSEGRYPIYVDDEQTGRLCPTTMLPVNPGLRKISVYVPARRGFVSTDVTVPAGSKPLPVRIKD